MSESPAQGVADHTAGKYFTVVFIGNLKSLEGNPFWYASDFGSPISIADGHALEKLDEILAHPQPAAGAEREEARMVLGAFYKLVDIMTSAHNSESKLMSVWEDDIKAVEAVMRFLETIRDATPHSPVRSGLEERTRMILQSTGMQATVQEAIMRHPHYSGSATSAYGFAGSALKAVLAALTGGDK